jgi:3-oxoacyl-[acyl-carrier-protein] synthase II
VEWSKIPSKIAAIVDDEELTPLLAAYDSQNRVYINKLPKFIQLALLATRDALKDANWNPTEQEDQLQTGVAIGSGVGNLSEIIKSSKLLEEGNYRKITPFFTPWILCNLAAGYVSIQHQLMGPNHCAVTACATGAHSIGDSYRIIERGDANVMVCGGTESSLDPLSFAGFCRGGALATNYNETPTLASRPFDADRSGFVMGEGCGILVLEELEHAKRRGARIYAEIVGYGMGGDGHHITSPRPDGLGQLTVMQRALRGLDSKRVSYVNAHATSTPTGDRSEMEAISKMFDKVNVSSIKGAVGHLLGAAGAVEAISTILSITNSVIPPTLNFNRFDNDISDNVVNSVVVSSKPVHQSIDLAISNSFGFGGTNACLAFSKYSK